jgi:hypothetical protein
MREIPLTQGKVALIDDEDYEWLAGLRWHYANVGYAKSSRLGYMHRLILCISDGTAVVDHVNGDKLDNRRCNLRIATRAQNVMNQRVSSANTSGFKGVSWDVDAGKWRAYINFQHKRVYIGLFTDVEEAALAYNLKAAELFGEFALLNEIPGRSCA